MPIDYSKWDHIDVSDDEDDTHPNIDKASLFKWRHEANVKREEEEAAAFTKLQMDVEDLRKKYDSLQTYGAPETEIKKAKEAFEKQNKLLQEKEEYEKKHPRWSVRNISKDGFDKARINKTDQSKETKPMDELGDMQEFFKKYEEEIKHFGMLSKNEESAAYLADHPYLACEHTGSYLVIWCVDLQVEGKTELMKRVAHQTVVMQYINELAKTAKQPARNIFPTFFRKIKDAEKEYQEAFNDELSALIDRVKKRAKERLDEALQEGEELSKEERMGPGGLDPIEVAESLPEELRQAFESRDIDVLKEVLTSMDPKDAEYHMQRCIDSGLWVPGS
eukprot:Clim_evm48s25 gene=Clim_evmTU48s25